MKSKNKPKITSVMKKRPNESKKSVVSFSKIIYFYFEENTF